MVSLQPLLFRSFQQQEHKRFAVHYMRPKLALVDLPKFLPLCLVSHQGLGSCLHHNIAISDTWSTRLDSVSQ
jgi:hypothetical protein